MINRVLLSCLIYLNLVFPLIDLFSSKKALAECLPSTVISAVRPVLEFPLVQRKLDEISSFKVMTYNVLNLFENVGKVLPLEGEKVVVDPARAISQKHIQSIAGILLKANPDIAILQEVEGGLTTLSQFNRNYLGSQYRPIMLAGNDERGINIAFLVKRDLPVDLEIKTHREWNWFAPWEADPKQRNLFSRDLPILILRSKEEATLERPVFVAIGGHFKSKRSSLKRDSQGNILPGDDPDSTVLRTHQIETAASIVQGVKRTWGSSVPIVFGADFNTTVGSSETQSLFAQAQLVDSLEVKGVPKAERVTHTYHPRTGPTEANQIDALLVGGGIRNTEIAQAQVIRYVDENGVAKPIPQTRLERDANPSDHFPVVLELDWKPIFSRLTP